MSEESQNKRIAPSHRYNVNDSIFEQDYSTNTSADVIGLLGDSDDEPQIAYPRKNIQKKEKTTPFNSSAQYKDQNFDKFEENDDVLNLLGEDDELPGKNEEFVKPYEYSGSSKNAKKAKEHGKTKKSETKSTIPSWLADVADEFAGDVTTDDDASLDASGDYTSFNYGSNVMKKSDSSSSLGVASTVGAANKSEREQSIKGRKQWDTKVDSNTNQSPGFDHKYYFIPESKVEPMLTQDNYNRPTNLSELTRTSLDTNYETQSSKQNSTVRQNLKYLDPYSQSTLDESTQKVTNKQEQSPDQDQTKDNYSSNEAHRSLAESELVSKNDTHLSFNRSPKEFSDSRVNSRKSHTAIPTSIQSQPVNQLTEYSHIQQELYLALEKIKTMEQIIQQKDAEIQTVTLRLKTENATLTENTESHTRSLEAEYELRSQLQQNRIR